MKSAIVALLVTGLMVASGVTAHAYYYPKTGDLYYNGYIFGDSYMNWGASPGPWTTNEGGYEHDFVVDSAYLSYCTSSTNLPNGYDDCPTAGASEPTHMWSLSFGSFSLKGYVQANYSYYGSWQFGLAGANSGYHYLNGQEVAPKFCPWWDIWCYGAFQTVTLLGGTTLVYEQPTYRTWSY